MNAKGSKDRVLYGAVRQFQMITAVIFLIIGWVMFGLFRKAQQAQARTKAIFWMFGSAIFSVIGLVNLVGAILG